MNKSDYSSLIGAMHERPTAPEAKGERLDLSRCVTYPTRSQNVAEGLFRAKYHCDPTVSMQASIGGKTKVAGWLCGMFPADWSEDTRSERKDNSADTFEVIARMEQERDA